jgi:hypothetical protein
MNTHEHLNAVERGIILHALGYTARQNTPGDYANALRAALDAHRRKQEALRLECQRTGRKFCLESAR